MSALFTQICYGEIMKKLVPYIFVGLMFCNVGIAKDLSGTILECKLIKMKKFVKFVSKNKVIVWDYMPSAFKYWTWHYYYKVDPKSVDFSLYADFKTKNPSSLDRETLKFGSYNCKIIEDFDVEVYLNKEIDQLKKSQEIKNKI